MSPDKSFIKYAITLLQVLRDKGGQLRLAETIEAAAERLGLANWQLDQPGFGGEPSIRTDLTWARAHLISWGYLTLVPPDQVRLSATGSAASNTGSIASAEELFSNSQRRFISRLQAAAPAGSSTIAAAAGRAPAPPAPEMTPAAPAPAAEPPPQAPVPEVAPVPAMEPVPVAVSMPMVPPAPIEAPAQEVTPTASPAPGAAFNREGLPTWRDLGTVPGNELISILDSLNPAIFGKLLENLLSRQGFTEVSITERLDDGSISGIGTLAINPLVGIKGMLHIKKTQVPISRALIREFRGTLVGRASKGIFVTTGRFTPEAREEAGRDGVDPIDLFDGIQLVRMLEELEIAVKARTVYDLDPLFFEI